jgi:hypothetical protein
MDFIMMLTLRIQQKEKDTLPGREAGMFNLHASLPRMSVSRRSLRLCVVRDTAGQFEGRGMAFTAPWTSQNSHELITRVQESRLAQLEERMEMIIEGRM